MLRETGTVVRIDPDALWVETLQRSACDSCNARSGCGQRVLGKALAGATVIPVLLNGRAAEDFSVHQSVVIGIPEDVIVKASLLLYTLPVLCLMLFVGIASGLGLPDGVAVMLAVVGLLLGGGFARWRSHATRCDPRQQPVLLDG